MSILKYKLFGNFSLVMIVFSLVLPDAFGQGSQRGGTGRGAGRGGEAGGGGDQYVAYFVRKAMDLLVMPRFEEGHRTAMRQGFERSRIITTPMLRYPNGEPVRDQEKMIAWSSPGLIQLKVGGKRHPSEDSWEEAVRSGRPIYHIVAHELWLASGLREFGLPIDNNFRLSLARYGLDQAYGTNMGISWDSAGIPYAGPARDDFGAPDSWYPFPQAVRYRNPPVDVPPPGYANWPSPYVSRR